MQPIRVPQASPTRAVTGLRLVRRRDEAQARPRAQVGQAVEQQELHQVRPEPPPQRLGRVLVPRALDRALPGRLPQARAPALLAHLPQAQCREPLVPLPVLREQPPEPLAGRQASRQAHLLLQDSRQE